MIFKCKMCGGDLDINQEMRICECQYCGSRQTLPKLGNEKRNNMFDRAGHFRRNSEYDKAMSLYEQILNEEAEDAEVYWSLVLCRYGIEYVEDPTSHNRIPTINRVQYNSILVDDDYKSALKYADEQQRAIYEKEAREIDRIQKGILAISGKEEPFDVFICYKESDANGRRTPDSVLANDLYHQLTGEGFRVFFARITLEDKLGSEYEPYIFAALNSAKVMVVLGTKPEYFNAVWVKNEWSRYLSLIKSGADKVLVPAYRDMDPYDLPEAFAHLQAQDMSKLGFMQDLIRGIKKLTNKEQQETKKSESVSAGNGAQALVERAFLFLEDGDFNRADELCEQALNQDPKNAKAYVAKLMVERRVTKQEKLSDETEELTEDNYFQKALRFAEDGLKKELERCNQMIMDSNKDKDYENALELVKQSGVSGGTKAAIEMLTQAIGKYEDLLGWKDSEAKLNECRDQRKRIIDEIYEKSNTLQEESGEKKLSLEEAIQKLKTAIEGYNSIAEFKNVDDALTACRTNLDRLYKIKKNNQIRKAIKILVPSVIAVIVIMIVATHIQKKIRYEEAYTQVLAAVEKGDYDAAVYAAKEELTSQEVDSLFYDMAKEKMENGEYEDAGKLFDCISGYKDSEEQMQEAVYRIATQFMEAGEYEEARKVFNSISGYKDSEEQMQEAVYRIATQFMEAEEYEEAREVFNSISGYKDSTDLADLLRWARLVKIGKGFRIESVDNSMELGQVVIPGCVTEIDDRAFLKCSSLTSITIPNSVMVIGEQTFASCSSLTSITIPDSVTKIGKFAFDLCSSLTDVTIQNGVTEIDNCAFYQCTHLTNITIPDSVTEIGVGVFMYCSSLTSITIPDGVTEIDDKAFSGCSSLTSVTIPNSVTKIGEEAFMDCSNLTSVTMPDSIEINSHAFKGTPLEEQYYW